MSCYSEYEACVHHCQPASGWNHILCIGTCVNKYLECKKPFDKEDPELIEVLDNYKTLMEEQILVSRALVDAKLGQRTVVKPGGIREPFLPNSKLRQRLRSVGIDSETTDVVTKEVALEFKDGQTSEDIRGMVLSKLENIDPELPSRFLGKTTA